MTENQKLREALQAISHIDDSTNHAVDASAALDRIGQIARQALAMPTAAPDMPLSMNQFGRLVELTREHLTDNTFVYKATSKAGDTCHFGVESAAKAWAKGGTVEAIKVREFKLHTSGPTADHLPDAGEMIETAAPVGEREAFEEWAKDNAIRTDLGAWDAWQARAALSAGDAGWQPIETAPKDGSDCWLLVEEEVRRGFWVEIEFEERRDLDGRYIDQTDDDAYWMDKDSGDSLEPTMFYPITKPLPPAPAMRKGQL